MNKYRIGEHIFVEVSERELDSPFAREKATIVFSDWGEVLAHDGLAPDEREEWFAKAWEYVNAPFAGWTVAREDETDWRRTRQ